MTDSADKTGQNHTADLPSSDLIVPVLLCGGSGTRLWPLSRKSFPKQFSNLTGEGSLFQQAATRLSGAGFARPVVVTNSEFRFIVVEQLAAAEIDPGAILIEPSGRNTAPAILAATLHIAAQDPKALILVAPSDHVVPDAAAFRAAIAAAMRNPGLALVIATVNHVPPAVTAAVIGYALRRLLRGSRHSGASAADAALKAGAQERLASLG